MNSIKETKDYEQFKLIDENRNLNRNHINKIKDSITEFGYVASNPILVNHNNEIIDGQHRFVACKEMGLPVYYIVEDGLPSKALLSLNTTQKSWSLEDYINYWATKGYSSYRLLISFCEYCSLGASTALCILGYSRGGKTTEKIKIGCFQTDSTKITEAKTRWKFIEAILDACHFGKSARVIKALVSLSEAKTFNWATMVKKLSRQLDRIHVCATQEGYENLFRELYNNRNSLPI